MLAKITPSLIGNGQVSESGASVESETSEKSAPETLATWVVVLSPEWTVTKKSPACEALSQLCKNIFSSKKLTLGKSVHFAAANVIRLEEQLVRKSDSEIGNYF